MEYYGMWACPDLYDCSLDVTDSGEVLVSFEEKGEYLRPSAGEYERKLA